MGSEHLGDAYLDNSGCICFNLLLSVRICVHAYVCVHVCVHISGVYGPLCLNRGQPQTLSALPHHFPPYSPETEILTDPRAGLVARKPTPVLLPPL